MTMNLSELARKRVAVAAYYFVPGVVFASWASRIPDVKHLLHLGNGQLGSVLFAIPIGQLLMMTFSGILVSKFGGKKMLVVSEVFYALALLSIGFSHTVFHLILSLVAFGMMANLMNIATNTQACFLEKMYGRNIMSSFHGLWSLGGFAGGIVGSIFASTSLPIPVHFGSILVMSLLVIAIGLRMAAGLPYLVTATLGFLLVGFGISSSVPICYSIAGKLGTMKASIALTIVSSISFFGFLVGPPVIGWLSEATDLRIAISIAACFGLFIAFIAGKVSKRVEG